MKPTDTVRILSDELRIQHAKINKTLDELVLAITDIKPGFMPQVSQTDKLLSLANEAKALNGACLTRLDPSPGIDAEAALVAKEIEESGGTPGPGIFSGKKSKKDK